MKARRSGDTPSSQRAFCSQLASNCCGSYCYFVLLTLLLFISIFAKLAQGDEQNVARPQLPLPEFNPDAPPADLFPQCLHLMQVGASSSSELGIGWGLPTNGWTEAIARTQAPVLNQTGVRWIWFHNPFGKPKGKRMQWTQLLQLQALAEQGNEGADRIVRTFLPAMRRLLSGKFTQGRRVGAVFYFGDATTDELLAPLLERGERDEWHSLWSRSIEPIRRLALEFPGQVMIGADSTPHLAADHPHYQLLHALHNKEMPVIGEPRPSKENTHLFEFGAIRVWRQDHGGFDRSDPARFPDARMNASNDDIRGPRYAGFIHANQTHVEQGRISLGHLRKALASGARPVLRLDALAEATLAQE